MVFGTFDIVHPGHINMFKQAKDLGDKLTVVVARDANVKKLKGRAPIHGYKKRIKNIVKLNIANEVIAGSNKDILKCIKSKKPDIIALGYDQKYFINELEAYIKHKKQNIKIIRLKPYKEKIYKTSLINIKNK